MFLTIEKLEKRARQLEAFRFVDMKSIAPFDTMPGSLGPDEVYSSVPVKVAGSTFGIGDEFKGRDGYLWARKRVALPPAREGFEVYGLFDFGKTGSGGNSGFESMLYVDGKPWQGVDTNHTDVNLDCLAGKDATLTFLLWTGLEGGGPKAEFRHIARRADVGYLHAATDRFYYLAKAIYKELRLLDDAEPAKHALTRALDDAFNHIDWDADRFYDTVDIALGMLDEAISRIGKHSDITVTCIGHTHIDVAWLWRIKHTREKAMRSFATALKLMDEFDEFVFLQSQPQLYKFIETDCPELFEKIRRRVKEGRWEADGGMWLEADCNISSGEALTRQFLYGIRYFKRMFNRDCEYLWLPDVFGYSWALPQILKGFNISTFMTTKISWNQYNAMPHDLFTWRGVDGSEVMAYFITTPEVGRPTGERFSTYNGMLSPRSVMGSWKKFRDKQLSNETLLSYGFGDGGGGVNRNMLKMRRAMRSLPGLPNVNTGTARDFFRRAHEKLLDPQGCVHVWDGELYLEYHRGTYTSQAWNKRENRRLEFATAECEWLMSMALREGGEYDKSALDFCWETILRNQFHDIIPGSSIGEVYEDCRREYAEVDKALKSLCDDAFERIANREEGAFTIYHSGSFPRRDIAYIQTELSGAFETEDGEVLPSQKVAGGYIAEIALDALGMKTVRFKKSPQPQTDSPFAVDIETKTLETPYYSIEWDETGAFTRVYDKQNAREAVSRPANVFEIYEDKPLNYDNWDIDIFYADKMERPTPPGQPVLIENGALRLVLRFKYTYRHSSIEQDAIFYANSRRIDFKTRVDWREDHRLLKAAFPINARSTKATYDIQYSHVERPTHFNTSWDYARFEVVAHKWADISQADYGVAILNDCKYGHSAKDNVLRITLLKSGKHPDTEADMGNHEFTYAMLPHCGPVAQSDVIEEAVKLNLPLRVRKGAAARTTAPLIAVDNTSVYIDAVKRAEDDDCLVARVHECRGGSAKATLTTGFPLKAWAKCKLLEENTSRVFESECVEFELKPFEIQTFKLW